MMITTMNDYDYEVDDDDDDDDDNGDSIVTSRSQLQFQRSKKSHLIRIYSAYCTSSTCICQWRFWQKSYLICIYYSALYFNYMFCKAMYLSLNISWPKVSPYKDLLYIVLQPDIFQCICQWRFRKKGSAYKDLLCMVPLTICFAMYLSVKTLATSLTL